MTNTNINNVIRNSDKRINRYKSTQEVIKPVGSKPVGTKPLGLKPVELNLAETKPEDKSPEENQDRGVFVAKEPVSQRRLQEAVIWSEILDEPLSKRRHRKRR